MTTEYEQRVIRRKKQRIARAKFPYIKQLSDPIKDELPLMHNKKFNLYPGLIIQHGRNVILAGNPGTGKTHIAIALAIQACNADFSVFFTTIPRLITQINPIFQIKRQSIYMAQK